MPRKDPRDNPCYFGFHYDLHAHDDDTRLGLRCRPAELMAELQRMGPDFVQTDCKGHAGYTSWFSRTPTASVPARLRKDALKQWREATRQLGLPLHCHYSGIWDTAAWEKHPDWRAVPPGKDLPKHYRGKMCPRGPYLQKLMIPQMTELIDRYDVDGFWIDGDIWGVAPCYCPRCRGAYRTQHGKNPPKKTTEPDWPDWWRFTLESFIEYVRTYTAAVHDHAPDVRVCSNWLHTFRCPGSDTSGTDFISGDNSSIGGLDQSRCEARYIASHRRPWDIMLWAFYFVTGQLGKPEHPPTFKPLQMLQQEAAVILSLGGGVQVYDHPRVRDGRLVPWHQERMGQLGRFVKARRKLCGRSETLPQVAVLHSEEHLRSTTRGESLMFSADLTGPEGATYALLENHYGADLLDEVQMLQRLDDYPVVVAPNRNAMSETLVDALKDYVQQGGRLLLTGADAWDRFGGRFLGVRKGRVEENTTFYLPHDDERFPAFSAAWRLTTPTTAEGLGLLGKSNFPDSELLPHPPATLRRVGKGRILYVPFDLFGDFQRNRTPATAGWVGELMRKLAGRRPIEIDAPTCIDVALRRQPDRTIIHLVNRATGLPRSLHDRAVDEIPCVGPIRITLRTAQKPRRLHLAFEKGKLASKRNAKTLLIELDRVHIHAAVVIEGVRMQRG